jgi:hypothetical protein
MGNRVCPGWPAPMICVERILVIRRLGVMGLIRRVADGAGLALIWGIMHLTAQATWS